MLPALRSCLSISAAFLSHSGAFIIWADFSSYLIPATSSQALSCVQSASLQIPPLKCCLSSSKCCLVQSLLRAHEIVKGWTFLRCGLHSTFASKREWWPQTLGITCGEDNIEWHTLLPVKCPGFGWQGLLEDRIPPLSDLLFVPCPMSISAGSTGWPGHVPCVSCHAAAVEEEISLALHIQNPKHSLSGFVVTPVSWSPATPHLGELMALPWPFFLCERSQNKQGCFSRGWMCEWWWDKDMETFNRKFLGLSGNVCSVIRVQVAQIQRLIVMFCLI